ncbi:TIGR02391 family protein [Agrobacterium tumefaciens]|nr:TIGR02391 family protein [Agrobacterium tumefaciens]NTE25061.1 TIGR02391 family protein [Agrobacterium tumefaciens]
MAKQPPLSLAVLEGISKAIGDTAMGLSGGEIAHLLANSRIIDSDPTNTKWKRLINAFIGFQNENQCSNNIYDFIGKAMAPVRYMNNQELFEHRRKELNLCLSFIGLMIKEDGIIGRVARVSTLSDAVKRADKLKAKLSDRQVHEDVIRFCRAELLADNYFHAVFETTKSIADKLRVLSGSVSDGAELIDLLFSVNNPVIIINQFVSDTEKSEHKGFANLLRGLFGMFRNTLAHAPKIQWEISEQDALDIMSLASLCHRRLDTANRIRML